MGKKSITWNEVSIAAAALADGIRLAHPGARVRLYGVPRGGVMPALLVAEKMRAAGVDAFTTFDPWEATHIVDDLVDSGKTRRRFMLEHPGVPFLPLFHKRDPSTWYVFPWEDAGGEDGSADDIPVRLLQYIGEDPARGGLLETPKRFLKAWDHWASGYQQDPADVLKVFEDGADGVDELVLVRDIPVYSHCEHHLAPFFGVAHVGYIPNGKIVGLSKLSRLVDVFSRRLQVQERLTTQIAHSLAEHLQPTGVGVIVQCRHLCMESRGVQRQGSSTTTSCMLGALRDDAKARAEFLQLTRGSDAR